MSVAAHQADLRTALDASPAMRFSGPEARPAPAASAVSIAVGVIFGAAMWCLIGFIGFELYQYLS